MGGNNTKERLAGILSCKEFAHRIKTSSGTFKCHLFILSLFFPLLKTEELVHLFNSVSTPAAKIIYTYLSYDDVEVTKLEQVPVIALYEVWKFSREHKLTLMENWIRSKIRNMLNEENVLEYGQCALNMKILDELGSVFKIIREKTPTLQEKLREYPDLAVMLATANLTEYPIEKLHVDDNELNILEKLWTDRTGSDIVLIVEDVKIMTHKAILAAESEYWRKQFRTQNTGTLVHISPLPLETFMALLHYQYLGTIETKPLDNVYLLLAQNFYQMNTYEFIKQHSLQKLKWPTQETSQAIKNTIKSNSFSPNMLEKLKALIDEFPDIANIFPINFIDQKLQHYTAVSGMVDPLTNRVAWLENENKTLREKIAKLENQNTTLSSRVHSIEQILETIIKGQYGGDVWECNNKNQRAIPYHQKTPQETPTKKDWLDLDTLVQSVD